MFYKLSISYRRILKRTINNSNTDDVPTFISPFLSTLAVVKISLPIALDLGLWFDLDSPRYFLPKNSYPMSRVEIIIESHLAPHSLAVKFSAIVGH